MESKSWMPATLKEPGVGAKASTLADLFVQPSCMPAGWLLGSFVWLITSPLRDTKLGRTCLSELGVSQPLVFTYKGGQGHGPHAEMTPSSFATSHRVCLNVGSLSIEFTVWTVTLAALCLREEMLQSNPFGRTPWWPLIWILSLHVFLKRVPVFFIGLLFVLS